MDNWHIEWAAMLHALEHARELKASNALFYIDSKLIEDKKYASCKVKMLSLKFILKT